MAVAATAAETMPDVRAPHHARLGRNVRAPSRQIPPLAREPAEVHCVLKLVARETRLKAERSVRSFSRSRRAARTATNRALAHMDLQLAPPHDAWDAMTQSWITELPQAALARAQAVPAASLTKAKLSISPPLSKPSPPWVPPPVVTPQVPAAEAAPPAAASGSEEVPMTPEAQEASSLALAWRLQQEEQAAFYHAIHKNTPGPAARSIAATPGEAPLMGALGEPESPEDASLQLALRLQQARDRSSL